MPFIIRNEHGQFLRTVKGNGVSTKRSWVASMDEASTWYQSGAAKNAAKHAPQARTIQEVRLMIWGSPELLNQPKKRR